MITSSASGSGRGEISFEVAPNPATLARTGSIAIGGQSVEISQDPGPPTTGTPYLTRYSSRSNRPGGTARVYGAGFKQPDRISILMGSYAARIRRVKSDVSITFRIPKKLRSGQTYSLYATVNGVNSNTLQVQIR